MPTNGTRGIRFGDSDDRHRARVRPVIEFNGRVIKTRHAVTRNGPRRRVPGGGGREASDCEYIGSNYPIPLWPRPFSERSSARSFPSQDLAGVPIEPIVPAGKPNSVTGKRASGSTKGLLIRRGGSRRALFSLGDQKNEGGEAAG